MVSFPTRIPDCHSHSPVLLDLFLSSDVGICTTVAFPPLGNSNHVAVPVSIDFPTNSKRNASFHRIAYDYSGADWDGLCDHLRDVPWEDIFKFSASAAASEFCKWVQVGTDVCIPHRKYQVKPHSSPCFSAACAAAIFHRNHFFFLYHQNKFSQSKVKFRQASNHCKSLPNLKLPNLHMLLKQKSPSLPRNLAFRTLGELPRDDTHMTSMKIVQFPIPPTPLSIYVQKSSTPLTLDVQLQTNPPPPPHPTLSKG